MAPDPKRFEAAIERFDAVNRQDPNKERFQGRDCPRELLYAERMTGWLHRLAPDASEALRLAARSQHIARWTIPRGNFPMDRAGYHLWRTTLARFHAETAGRILREVGYDEAACRRVEGFLLKKDLKSDPEMQLLEDVICLVFLESYLSDFSQKYDEEKLKSIVRKTWKKMSPRGREAALQLDLRPADRELIEAALKT